MMLTTTRRIHHAAIVSALACALFASAIGTATAGPLEPAAPPVAASSLALAPAAAAAQAKTPAPAKLTASEQAYVRGIASLTYEQIAAAYNPAWRGEQSSATVVKGLGPRERRYVQRILRLTPEQVRAGFGTVQP